MKAVKFNYCLWFFFKLKQNQKNDHDDDDDRLIGDAADDTVMSKLTKFTSTHNYSVLNTRRSDTSKYRKSYCNHTLIIRLLSELVIKLVLRLHVFLSFNEARTIRLRPSRGQMFEAKAEAEAKSPRQRPRPKFWPRDRFGLEALTYLVKIEALCEGNKEKRLFTTV